MEKQKGISFWGFVWGAAFLICAAVVAVRSIPPYLNNAKISNALERLGEEHDIMTAQRVQLLRKLKRRLNIDYADEYVDLNKAFQIKTVKQGRQITIDYEVVVPLFSNANLLFIFDNELLVTRNPDG